MRHLPFPLRLGGGLPGGVLLLLGLGCSGGSHASLSQGEDFQIFISPGTLQLPAGSQALLGVMAIRGESCPEEVTLSVPGLPTGITATGAIPRGQARGTLKVTVDPGTAPGDLGRLEVVGQTRVLRLQGKVAVLERKAPWSLTVLKALQPPQISPDRTQAGGSLQKGGALTNESVLQEPVHTLRSADASGFTEVRHGFLPTSPNGSR